MYEAYLFDLYGTLVDIRTDEGSDELWRKLSVFYGYHGAHYTADELHEAYLYEEKVLREQRIAEIGNVTSQNMTKQEYDCTEIVIEYAFQKLFERKGIQASLELSIHAGQFFRVLSLQYIKLYPKTIELLEGLKNRGKKIYLISNAQQIFTEYEMNFLDIKKYFDGIYFSSDAGFMKPDSRFYRKAIEEFKVDPSKSIMIGNDFTCDILGAKAVGLDGFYVHTNISPEMPEDMGDVKWMMGMNGEKVLEMIG